MGSFDLYLVAITEGEGCDVLKENWVRRRTPAAEVRRGSIEWFSSGRRVSVASSKTCWRGDDAGRLWLAVGLGTASRDGQQ